MEWGCQDRHLFDRLDFRFSTPVPLLISADSQQDRRSSQLDGQEMVARDGTLSWCRFHTEGREARPSISPTLGPTPGMDHVRTAHSTGCSCNSTIWILDPSIADLLDSQLCSDSRTSSISGTMADPNTEFQNPTSIPDSPNLSLEKIPSSGP